MSGSASATEIKPSITGFMVTDYRHQLQQRKRMRKTEKHQNQQLEWESQAAKSVCLGASCWAEQEDSHFFNPAQVVCRTVINQQPSSWSSQHPGSPGRDICQDKSPCWYLRESIQAGMHTNTSAVCCCALTQLVSMRSMELRALDTASLGWMVEGLINIHGVVRLQKGVCTFINEVQSWSAEEKAGDLAIYSYVL